MIQTIESDGAAATRSLRRPYSIRARAARGLLALLAPLLAHAAHARSGSPYDEVGRFFMQSYALEDYGAHAQNWDMAQDERGFLYVANGAGVLEYDGVSWRLIPTANRTVARSLALGPEGRIFVGAVAEIGYLDPDPQGRLRYVSLLEHIPEEDRGFTDVWSISVLSDGIYFRSEERLFRYRDGLFDVWRPQTKFHKSFALRDALYATDGDNIELFVLEHDRLRLAPGSAQLAGKRISALLPDGPEAFLVATRNHGLARCRGSAREPEICEPYAPELTEMLAQMEPYSVVRLPDEVLAIGTRRGGLVLIDRDAHLVRVLNKASGLRSDAVWFAKMDSQGGLWLGQNDGLTRIEVTAPLSYFDTTTGLPETVVAVTRHRGRLYVANSRGVSVLESAAGSEPRFQPVPVPGLNGFCWSLISTPEGLLAGCAEGLYDVEQKRWIWQLPTDSVYSLLRSKHEPTRLYMGLRRNFARMTLEAGSWQSGERFASIKEQVRSIAEDDQGQLWLGTRAEGVLRLKAGALLSDAGAVRHFHVEDGLAVGWLETNIVGGKVRVMVDEAGALFRFDVPTDRFVADDALLPPGGTGVKELAEDDQGRVWIAAGEASAVARPAAGEAYSFAPTALRRMPKLQPVEIIPEPGGAVWIPSAQGLVRLDPEKVLAAADGYPVWLRRVTASDGSILFNGEPVQAAETRAWPFEHNALRFAFAAPRFGAPELTQYRTRLEGFEKGWSAWTSETYKDYTNLWEGRYVFRVEARDVYGFKSREDSFALSILPPWYRDWWAYGLYSLALIVVILASVRLQGEKLQREREGAERERAINARLREVDKLRAEFLANTSHELRTPLYGIIGLAESMHDAISDGASGAGHLPASFRDQLASIVASGQRLQRLVGDVLDFSSLEQNRLALVRKPLDLKAIVATVFALLRPLADGKGLSLIDSVAGDLPALDADERRLEQILLNFVGNAIKFTDTGEVEVSARSIGEKVRIAVRDTGIGIASEHQERIFQAFEQADGSIARQLGGTGLGLAVSRRLVELHGGEIGVESRPGEGATFTFTLPTAETGTEVAPIAELRAPPGRPADSSPIVADSSALSVQSSARIAPDSEKAKNTDREMTRILVVDDEPVNRLILQRQVEAAGYEAREAADGFQALDRLEDIDLVLLDVMMPRMSGYEVCRKLRESFSIAELPVIFVTAKGRAEDLAEGFAVGGNDYLVKPVGMAELLSRIEMHLDLAKRHRQLGARVNELEELGE